MSAAPCAPTYPHVHTGCMNAECIVPCLVKRPSPSPFPLPLSQLPRSLSRSVAGLVGTLAAGTVHDLNIGVFGDPRILSAACLVPGMLALLALTVAGGGGAAQGVWPSVAAVSLLAAGTEVGDYLLVGPTALRISTAAGQGDRYLGRLAGCISGTAALASALTQAFALDLLGPEQLIGLLLALQVGGVAIMTWGALRSRALVADTPRKRL